MSTNFQPRKEVVDSLNRSLDELSMEVRSFILYLKQNEELHKKLTSLLDKVDQADYYLDEMDDTDNPVYSSTRLGDADPDFSPSTDPKHQLIYQVLCKYFEGSDFFRSLTKPSYHTVVQLEALSTLP